MSVDYHTEALGDALRRLASQPFPPGATAHLRAHAERINAELAETILARIPAFSASGNPDVLPELARHGPRHTEEILRLLDGGRVRGFDFIDAHARRRAEQRFPLDATLHAYRLGHKVYSRWLRQATLAAIDDGTHASAVIAALADFAIEYTDAISTVAAGAYLDQTRLLADLAGDQRAELLRILLEGYDEADGRVAKILHEAGYLHRRQAFCVALAQPVDPGEMHNPARARRLCDAIDKLFRRSTVRRLVDVHDYKVTVVFSDTRRASGWTAPHTSLARRVTQQLHLVGNAALIGVSNDVPSTSHIPTAYREARFALELAHMGQRVLPFASVPLPRLILHLAGDDYQRVLPTWTGAFFTADELAAGSLIGTLRAYANADMNALRAARELRVHTNTVYARLQKVRDLTGLDAKSYHALTELLLVADCRPGSAPEAAGAVGGGTSAAGD